MLKIQAIVMMVIVDNTIEPMIIVIMVKKPAIGIYKLNKVVYGRRYQSASI